jgi:hypothetical protein
VFLSREDYNKIFRNYEVMKGVHKRKVNYHQLTDDIGANNNSIKVINQTKKYLSQVKQLRASSDERKYRPMNVSLFVVI